MSKDGKIKLPAPVSVEVALSSAREDIRVQDRETLEIGPFTRFAQYFSIAEIKEFTDLHHLGYVPKEMGERDAVEAVRADDEIYYRDLRDKTNGAACRCNDSAEEAPRIRRRDYQDNFWKLVQPLYREPVSFADTAVIHPYSYVQSWLKRPAKYYVGISLLRDIYIGKMATLRMTHSVSTVHANEVTIEDGGRFRFEGKKIHVKCNVLNGPSPFLVDVVHKYLTGFIHELEGGEA